MRSTRTRMIRSTLLAAAVVLASASSALAMPPEQEYGGEGGYTAVWQATDLVIGRIEAGRSGVEWSDA